MGDMKQLVLEELSKSVGAGEFQLTKFFEKPIHIGSGMQTKIEDQRQRIDCFLDILIVLARTALSSNDTVLTRLLFSEPIAGMDLEYHRKLPDCCWSKPVFYRTDQSVAGKIYEVQSPGSGWGDIPLYANCLQKLGYDLSSVVSAYNRRYAQCIASVTKRKQPRVYHMLDAASVPVGMRYLFTQTRPMIKYWGLDPDVSMYDVDYVTAHSAASLVTSNYFRRYLSQAKSGHAVFGIPPNLVFDQKAIYLLPFYRHTASAFSDDTRALFPFTTLIESGGFYDANGQFESLTDFAAKPESQRHFFLKYGGPDLNRNWGGRSVNRLSGSDCLHLLNEANELSQTGDIWLLQEDVSRNETDNLSDDIKQIIADRYHVKLSAFQGTDCTLGIKVMARKHFKVHGQNDTYAGLGVFCVKHSVQTSLPNVIGGCYGKC